MSYLPHQVETSDKAYAVLKERGICMIAGLPRTGKTRTAIRVAERTKLTSVLVITKKAAIPGWHKELEAVHLSKHYTVVNYEQVHKLDKDEFDFVVVDESHNLGRPGKPTQRLKSVRALAFGKPVLLLTGTPAAETRLSYYYQFCLSPRSPFASHKNFYSFFREYGEPCQVYVNGRMQETYTKGLPTIEKTVKPYIVTLSQDQAGIKHKAQDQLHVVPLTENTKAIIRKIKKDKVWNDFVADSDIKERAAIHQIEYGGMLINDEIVLLDNTEVVDYLYKVFGDSSNIGFMAHYRSTVEKLRARFKHAKIYSSSAHAEGVNLAHLKHFVIVNSDYSGAKFIQRRDRITNITRTTPAIVHHIVTDGGISGAVYNSLSDKKDFTLRLYRNDRAADAIENH
jgi:hypothetical protein